MQVAGAGEPLGVEATLFSVLEGLRGCGLARFVSGISLLATLAIKGLQGVAKVLIEFCSDFIVAQKLPAGGRRVLLVPVSGGLLQWGLGGFNNGLLP